MTRQQQTVLFAAAAVVAIGVVVFATLLQADKRRPVADFLGFGFLQIVGVLAISCVLAAGLYALWWMRGRDRWFGDVAYLTGSTEESVRPATARDTVVTEYAPPTLPSGRALLPAEIEVLIKETMTFTAYTATLVDLTGRGYLAMKALGPEPEHRLLASFDPLPPGTDIELRKLKEPDDGLLPFERAIYDVYFNSGDVVNVLPLMRTGQFDKDINNARKKLLDTVVRDDALFTSNPEVARSYVTVLGLVLLAGGAGLIYLLGKSGAGIWGLPFTVTGFLLIPFGGFLTTRTALGRELYRRCLGFQEYVRVADKDRAQFSESQGIFNRSIAYAVIFRVAELWDGRFLALQEQIQRERNPPSNRGR